MTKSRKRMNALLALGAAGVLFQIPGVPGSCTQFLGQTLITGFDFCSVVNCGSGNYFDFCDNNSIFVLVDCPQTAANP
ncbi:MAG: hypothetical protein HZB38_18505 [Planctomycetes bacterium]|nr:hypothetical protein [Planctomycetota bacterium]